jgi:hypothetical protein
MSLSQKEAVGTSGDVICPVCGEITGQEKCKVIFRSDTCRGRGLQLCGILSEVRAGAAVRSARKLPKNVCYNRRAPALQCFIFNPTQVRPRRPGRLGKELRT